MPQSTEKYSIKCIMGFIHNMQAEKISCKKVNGTIYIYISFTGHSNFLLVIFHE